MFKYLVKVNYVHTTEIVNEIETQRKTSTVESYGVKYITDNMSLPRGGDFIFIQTPEVLKSPIVSTDEEDKLILIEDPAKLVEEQVKELYDGMVTDIYAALDSTFGTKNDVSAAAFVSTWEAMARRPFNFIDEELGLLVEDDVIQYAASKILAADAYGVFRLKRINKFEADKKLLLGQE